MNKVIISGRIANDLELKHSKTGKAVLTFSLAVDGPKVNGEKTTVFADCVAWDKSAELVSQYKAKGDYLLVEGRLNKRSYQAQDGSKRYVTEIIVTSTEFGGGAGRKSNSNVGAEFGSSADEEIPF